MTQCQSVSTFESEVQNSLSVLEPHSTDTLGHQHSVKKLSPKITLHVKVLRESKAMLPYTLQLFLQYRNFFMEYIVVVGCRHCVTTYIPHTRLDNVLNHRIISGPQ